jgi:hypothetical protein
LTFRKSENLCRNIYIIKFSKILEEHQDKCEKSGRFVEAEMAKQRVAQFKKLEEEKLLNETKRTHEEQVRKKN